MDAPGDGFLAAQGSESVFDFLIESFALAIGLWMKTGGETGLGSK